MIFPPDDDTEKAAYKTTVWGRHKLFAIDMPWEI
jgi:hypothetical protein